MYETLDWIDNLIDKGFGAIAIHYLTKLNKQRITELVCPSCGYKLKKFGINCPKCRTKLR